MLKKIKNLAVNVSAVLLLSSLLAPAAMADATVKFHGTLIAGSCSASAVDVDFGDVKVDDITEGKTRTNMAVSSGASAQSFSMTISCTNGFTGGVEYQFKGNASSFNNLALSTDVPSLGVIVAINDSNMSNIVPSTWYPLSKGAGTYQMLAMLVREPGAKFAGGDFNATATLAVQIP